MAQLPYKSILGRLLHIAITCRPDIAPAVSSAGRYGDNPGQQHWDALVRIVKYLNATKDYVLTLGGTSSTDATVVASFAIPSDDRLYPHAYADADWGGDKDKHRFRTGLCIFFGTGVIIYMSKVQASNSLSSTEAEYIALATCAQEVIWLRTILTELGFKLNGPTVIYEDNKSCIDIATSLKQHPGVKHIDLRYHFIRDRILIQQDIAVVKKATGDMTADLFTKQLPGPAFAKHRHSLNVRMPSS